MKSDREFNGFSILTKIWLSTSCSELSILSEGTHAPSAPPLLIWYDNYQIQYSVHSKVAEELVNKKDTDQGWAILLK